METGEFSLRGWLRAMVSDEFADGAVVSGEIASGDAVTSGNKCDLSPQQSRAVHQGLQAISRYGGVILADAVGLGKTRSALALARRVVGRRRRRGSAIEPALFVAPARLRPDWEAAIARAGWQDGRDAQIVSHYALSRRPFSGHPPVVVVDEAHRFRNPGAQRSQHLMALTGRAPPILVTATPVCTQAADLHQLLSYFLSDEIVKSLVGMGLDAAFSAFESGAFDLVEILQEVVIRRLEPDFGERRRPGLRFEVVGYEASHPEQWLWKHLEARLRGLNFAATDRFWPSGLLINHLLRLWESGPQALATSLDKLLHFHERWLAAAAMGKQVERPDFLKIFGDVDRQQQVFSFVYGQDRRPDRQRVAKVSDDLSELAAISARVDEVCRQKSGMIAAIVDLVKAKRDQSFLIFCAYRGAAEAIWKALADNKWLQAGLVTGQKACATGLGAVDAREAMRRFRRFSKIADHRSLRILVATDCLSEGLNLQGCTNLILADLPYSPVKLEQRIGRIARPGAGVDQVQVYLLRPRSWSDSLGLRRRLGGRMALAQQLGAGHQLAPTIEEESAGAKAGDEAISPLAALTKARQLWDFLAAVAPVSGRPFAAVGDGDRIEKLWVRVAVKTGVKRRFWVLFEAPGQAPLVRLSDQISGLAGLVYDEGHARPWEPAGPLWDDVRRWVERKQAVLEAARLAPPLLGAGSAPVRLWSRLKTVDDERAPRWRRRLLQPHPPGRRAEMERLLADEPAMAGLVRFVESLPDPEITGPIEVAIFGALAQMGSGRN